jgi:hypothetical protein
MNTRTPAQGGSGSQSTIFTPYTGVLPDNVSIAMNAGFSFFKVMCIGVPTGTTIFGMYDVNVKQVLDQINIANVPRFDTEWLRGRGFERGDIRLVWDRKTNRSFAYVVDDPAWKNRLNFYGMRESGKYVIGQYLTPKGLIDGAVMTEQIKLIGDRLHDYVVTFDGKEHFRGKDITEARAFEVKFRAGDKNKRCQVVTMPATDVQELIAKYGPLWMEKDEFVLGIRAEIEAEIAEKFTMTPQAVQEEVRDPKAIVTEAFSMLTPQERLEILQGMAGQSINAEPERPEIIQKKLEPTPIPSAAALEILTMPQLKEIAEDNDIFTQGMQREDIVKELKAKSNHPVAKSQPQGKQAQKQAPAKEEVIT